MSRAGETCPCCGPPWGEDPKPPPEDAASLLRVECAMRSIPIIGAGFVDSAGAAALTGYSEKTLRNWRAGEARNEGPPVIRKRRRPLYPLADLAAWMEAR